MIPKIIHYCWLSDNPIPEELKGYMNSWKEKLPDYEFMLWNFKRFDKSSSVWVSQAFDSKKYAFAADYIRLYAVYSYGGIYMDMDVEVLKKFDDFLDADLMMAYEDDSNLGIEAGVFGASKENPFIAEVLTYYDGRQFIKPDGSFDMLPLPKIIKSYADKHPELTLYTKDFFTAKSTKTGKIERTDNTVTIHHFAGSWVPAWRKYGRKVLLALGGQRLVGGVKKIFFRKLQ